MTNIDYDIVILGDTIAAYQAALNATGLNAKVALIVSDNFSHNYYFNHQYVLNEISKITQQSRNLVNLGIDENTISLNWKKSLFYAISVSKNLTQINSLPNLAAQGVDIIVGNGQFQSSPLSFIVNERRLYSRTYLLANGSRPLIPNIPGLDTIEYLTLTNIWDYLEKTTLPKNWVILGGIPQSIEIAQILAQFGCNITLIVKKSSIIPHLDPEINQLLIAQLEVNGVRVLTQTKVTQIRHIDNQKWVQAGNQAIETDEIFIATGQQPNSEYLNLSTVGIKYRQHRLIVNEKLQTTNHRIYACGDVIGGYNIQNLSNYEANIAIKNALFFPRLKVNYHCVPWGIYTYPKVTQIGLTEIQAKSQYPQNQVLVFKQYFKTATSAQIQGQITGICKLIVFKNGKILGCSILGIAAGELINIISLAINQNIKIQHLAKLSPIYPSLSEILIATAREWHKQRINKNHAVQELLASFFNFRRDWNL
ncbi:dihydrolipoyl dehydrogenase family protein [Dolichospermum circinale]|uniref:dihydrolipoyl dehydrogenase family protein n=1 Tax=Dolichospermum circinale TaxID=109265 RepID=UPI00042532E4|nr:NAD(P)/FAD-dependent oxidoreductase [Dolichospermum circinale]MDB9454554.1 NAD(P)/FAD-dependent oxidoreductase [Dolichospermum circinale CS-541/06]MDB9461049.1 NAD(P)/FAD-dependent oxidoreductase [Dolichospermum circinale CS-541/04]MDB9476728.1 NAD(P)/FAD-dependent oxidoreductase [Dolichospermum circinale CS-537/11]MDB9480415.1 NAD(P)/FAD-dependent oxidoreductase [Dolichospermum circinale CS-537/03]MDB9492992.1 NAD(P)/FAD-dependent oxidoreductase [Dolichospermum circinale CS-534/05]